MLARVKGDRYLRRAEANPDESALDKLTRETIARWVTPRWKRHLERLVEAEKPDAVIVFTIPMAHLRGIPDALRERFGIPIVFYDGDVPMSLPEYGGMDTGFNPYHGADPWEYDLVRLELGGRDRAAARARRAPGRGALLGRRPRVLRAAAGREGGRRLLLRIRRQVPARLDEDDGRRAVAPRARARLRARRPRLPGRHRRRAELGDIPFNVFARAISAARVNLNMTRRPHATVAGSSTARPFELASSGAAIVSNPHEGIERWFEPGRELVIVESAEEAVAAYRELVADPAQAEEMGRRARERVLDEHTYAHRARRLLELVGLEAGVAA